MINGVLFIVAAVLFAVVYLFGNLGIMWLWIAAVYLVFGVVNLTVYYLKNKSKLHAANKQAAKTAKQAEEALKQVEAVKAQEQAVKLPEPVKEEQQV